MLYGIAFLKQKLCEIGFLKPLGINGQSRRHWRNITYIIDYRNYGAMRSLEVHVQGDVAAFGRP